MKSKNFWKKVKWNKVAGAIIALASVGAGVFASWVDDQIVRTVLMGAEVVSLCVASYWWFGVKKTNYSPCEEIIKVLLDAGFECGITEDDDICIKLGNKPIFAHVVELPGGKRRVHFSAMIHVADKKISEQGLNYMISKMNSSNEYYTMLLRKDVLECRVATVVDRAKDVLQEMDFALEQFGNALRVMEKNIGSVAEKYPMQKSHAGHKIGFVIPSGREELAPSTKKKRNKNAGRKRRSGSSGARVDD